MMIIISYSEHLVHFHETDSSLKTIFLNFFTYHSQALGHFVTDHLTSILFGILNFHLFLITFILFVSIFSDFSVAITGGKNRRWRWRW